MSKFNILVHGRNFRFAFQERRRTTVKRTGFYVWRAVEAADPADAELRVMDLLRAAPSLRENQNSPADPPVMFVHDIRQLPDNADIDSLNRAGFVFFHGRGAGRPRSLIVAAKHLLPDRVRRVVERIWPDTPPKGIEPT